jgi:nucleoid DNA-binding protein
MEPPPGVLICVDDCISTRTLVAVSVLASSKFGSQLTAKECLTARHDKVIPEAVRNFNQPKTMTLTKRDLVIRISSETGLVQQQVFAVVQKTLDYISEALAKGDKVELRNFGVFEVKVRKARVGRNPNAPETDVPIPERSVVKFKSGKEMRAAVFKLPPKKASQTPQN